MAFQTLINRLSILGHSKSALEVARQYLALYRGLAGDTIIFDGPLAAALKTFSKHLLELGNHREALRAAGESADLYRDLPKGALSKADLDPAFWDIFNHLLALDVERALLAARDYATRCNTEYSSLSFCLEYVNKFSSRVSEIGHPKLALELIQTSLPRPGKRRTLYKSDQLTGTLETVSACIRALRGQNEPEVAEIVLDVWDRIKSFDELRGHLGRVQIQVQPCIHHFRSVIEAQKGDRASGSQQKAAEHPGNPWTTLYEDAEF